MKSIFKIYHRYVLTACLMVIFVVFINLAVWIGYSLFQIFHMDETISNKEAVRTGRYQVVADDLVQTDRGYVLGESGQAVLRENGCAFLLLLDGNGHTVYSWQKPEEIPDSFSAGDIGAFSKWYLKDYPVGVWRCGEEGLLVFGYPKDSLVRYNPTWKTDELYSMLGYIQVFILFNAGLVLMLALLFGYRFYRSLKPVGEGIDALAEGRSVCLRERGMTQYLREKINQTSRLLEKQKKELARRDTARTEWIAGVSHDIRTPLSLIVGYADEMATDERLNAETRQKAVMIRSQSFTIKKLIEDLNLTSKLTYHMQPLRRENYVPAVWLRQTAALMLNGGEIPEEYDVEMDVDPELERLFMNGDVQLLTRALQNLLGNSVRHNPGGCLIELKARKTEDGFCFCVKDSGGGIPDIVQRIVRDDGQEGENARGEGGREAAYGPKGQGKADGIRQNVPEKDGGPSDRRPHVMGLRVVKQIVCAHGGVLWFEDGGRAVWASVKDIRG